MWYIFCVGIDLEEAEMFMLLENAESGQIYGTWVHNCFLVMLNCKSRFPTAQQHSVNNK